ncbi:MAG: HDOD domain-containing protein, partial [Terracidiphilus sp.]
EMLKVLQQRPLDIARTAELVKRDGPLVYQVLRLANSPLWGLADEVKSIERALLAIGDERFRRVATTAIAAEFNGGQPPELLCMATIRARFCEQAGQRRGMDGFTQYLLGLLSLLPAMQGQSMADLVASLPLSGALREALLGEPNAERVLLTWLEFQEQARWEDGDLWAQQHGLDPDALDRLYTDSVAWSEATLHAFR